MIGLSAWTCYSRMDISNTTCKHGFIWESPLGSTHVLMQAAILLQTRANIDLQGWDLLEWTRPCILRVSKSYAYPNNSPRCAWRAGLNKLYTSMYYHSLLRESSSDKQLTRNNGQPAQAFSVSGNTRRWNGSSYEYVPFSQTIKPFSVRIFPSLCYDRTDMFSFALLGYKVDLRPTAIAFDARKCQGSSW